MLAGGVTLLAARGAIGASLDRWLPKLERDLEEAPVEQPAALPTADPSAEQPSEPQWRFVDVEAAVLPLPERTDALIDEGRAEVSQFTGLGSADETRALVAANRWRLWGPVWHNRVERIRGPMPPAEACDIHAALEPTCRAVRDSLALLDRVPAAGTTDEARELLDAAAEILEQLRESQAEPVIPPEPTVP